MRPPAHLPAPHPCYHSGMDDTVQVQCPYCFELVELYIDPVQRGEMVQDCDVCCRPWRVLVSRRRDGSPAVVVDRAD
jgi:hypothetical protein